MSKPSKPETATLDVDRPDAVEVAKPCEPDTRLLRWASKTLLADQREAVIEHHGVEYRLRLTGQGKLILTK